MASAAESKYNALFLNGQSVVLIQTTLTEMGRPQPPTPIQVDNATAVGISNKSIRQKMSKSMDMRFSLNPRQHPPAALQCVLETRPNQLRRI